MKILNLYAGIGGNRKLWTPNGDEHEITAVENVPEIAKIYADFFPKDKIVIGDEHQYLLDHYKEFDFVWSSPPCPSHSRINTLLINGKGVKPRFPDMKLYEEIIFMKHFAKCKYVIENVIGYYEPIVSPQVSGRHYYWANFHIPEFGKSKKVRNDKGSTFEVKSKDMDMHIKDFHGYGKDKRTLINNCVEPEIGLAILKESIKEPNKLF